jgi:predicted nucleic acid-binding protein
MKLDYLIDSNIFIFLLNDELAELIPEGSLGYSIITKIEILAFTGLSQDEEQLIRNSLQALSQIPLSSIVAEKTIHSRRKYRLKTPDAVIAASAWESQAVLLSNDRQLAQINEVQVMSLKTKFS